MHTLVTKAGTALAATALGLGTLAVSTGPADAAVRHYKNCTALHKVWKKGVAKGPAAAQRQVKQGNARPAYSPQARKVYWANKPTLDRDKDGTACETS